MFNILFHYFLIIIKYLNGSFLRGQELNCFLKLNLKITCLFYSYLYNIMTVKTVAIINKLIPS